MTEHDCLEHRDESSLKLGDCMKSFMKVFFPLTGGTEIVNAQGSDKDWYLTSWNKYTNIYTPTYLIIIKVWRNFKESLHPNLITLKICRKLEDANQKIRISQKMIFLKRWFHVFLLIQWMFTSESNVYQKLLILGKIVNES